MSRVLQKINEALWLKSANAKRPGVGSTRTPADNGGESKIGKILRMSFMDDPLLT